MSAQASDMSGWLLMGLPGLAYCIYAGTTEAIWTAIGLAVGTYLNWLIVAKRLRQYTKISGDAVTLPEFFANRFRDESGILKGISAFFILIFFIFYTASMFSSSAKLFKSVFGMEYTTALIIGVVIIVIYTFLGGFLAVCWTDMIQGILIFIALVVVPVIAYIKGGGIDGIQSVFETVDADKFNILPFTDGGALDIMLLISSIAWGLGYFGQPHILPRFMAIKSPKEIRPARVIATIWVVITLGMAIVVGVAGRALYPGLADTETIFIVMVKDLFPPVLTGIFLTAILAAIMSSADSQLLVASSAMSKDIYGGVINKKAGEKKLMWLSRISVVIISILAALLVSVENPKPDSLMEKINESVFDLVSFAWAGFGAAFGPIVLFSLFWKKTTKPAAVAGIIVGAFVTCVWWMFDGGILNLYEIVPGFLLSSLVIVVVSLFTKADDEMVEEFEKVKSVEI